MEEGEFIDSYDDERIPDLIAREVSSIHELVLSNYLMPSKEKEFKTFINGVAYSLWNNYFDINEISYAWVVDSINYAYKSISDSNIFEKSSIEVFVTSLN